MNVLAMMRERKDPTEEEIREYFGGKSLPLQRFCGTGTRHSGVSDMETRGGIGMKYVNAPVRKKDAMALVTGQPVYTDDLAPADCLIVKVLRSPHAHAPDTGDPYRRGAEGTGCRLYFHLAGCPQQALHLCRPDLPRNPVLMIG